MHTFIYGIRWRRHRDRACLRHPEACGLVVEGTFTSIPELAKVLFWIFRLIGLLHQRFDALARCPMLQVPTLFFTERPIARFRMP